MANLTSSACLVLAVLSLVVLTFGYPNKESSKIRIHIPVKHHTHVHTKTIIKKVPVPVPVPVKEHIPKKAIKYEVDEEEDSDDSEGYQFSKASYSKKKRRVHHPFL